MNKEELITAVNYFTTYWKNATWKFNRLNADSDLLDHTSSQSFRERVQPGDAVYVVTNLGGDMYVACKIIVEHITDGKGAAAILSTSDLWPSDHHIIAARSTRLNWDRKVPHSVARRLEFHVGEDRTSRLGYAGSNHLDRQTLRGTRMLTEASAQLLDKLLGPLIDITNAKQSIWKDNDPEESDLESALEGRSDKRYVTYYERVKANRDKAIRIHGLACKACEMSFEEMYGDLGKTFIHVHHTVPVSQFERERKPDIEKEMTVLCPNCHAMVHRKKAATLSVAELRRIIYDNRTRKTRKG